MFSLFTHLWKAVNNTGHFIMITSFFFNLLAYDNFAYANAFLDGQTCTFDIYACNEESLIGKVNFLLARQGFENISAVVKDGHLIVSYENRIYRSEARAIKEVIKTLSPLLGRDVRLSLVYQKRHIPINTISIFPEESLTSQNIESLYEEDQSIDDSELDSVWKLASSIFDGKISRRNIEPEYFVSNDIMPIWRELRDSQNINSHFYKIDVIIHPKYKALYGSFDNPVEAQIGLAPELNFTFWKGMSISVQLIITIYDDLNESDGLFMPGLITYNQFLRLPFNTFLSTTVGYFTEDRYGTDLEIRKYLANGNWSLGANMGYTGYASYLKGKWLYSHLGLFTMLLDMEYRSPIFDLSLKATYGRFLYKDRGWRFDIIRQVNEIELGFFVIKTELGHNGGFGLSIPLFPAKYMQNKIVRIRTAKNFSTGYVYRGLYSCGIQYDTGNRIDEFMRDLNPDHLMNQINESDI